MIWVIAFMYVCCAMLVPFIVFAVTQLAAGDRMREREAAARVAAMAAAEAGDIVATDHAEPTRVAEPAGVERVRRTPGDVAMGAA